MSQGIYPTPLELVGIGDTPNLDAFSRLRVSQPSGIFNVQQQYGLSTFLLEYGATGTGVAGAHNANTRMADLVVGAGTGTSFVQSYEYFPYQPGKSQLFFITFVLGAGSASCVKDVGAFDAANGIFLRQNGTSGLQVIRRTSTSGSVVNNAVAQADWNLDRLDGTGASGVTFDPAMSQILVIDAQFLAMGRVRIGFDIGGKILYVHQFLNANVIAVPYMQTLTLPVQMLMSTTSAAGACSFKCASVISEGGADDPNAYSFMTAEQTVTAGSGAMTHIASLRPLTTFGGFTNRCRLSLITVEILVTGNYPVHWMLAVGCTFSGAPTWGAVNAESSAEQTTAVGTLATAPYILEGGYVPASAQTRGALSRGVVAKYPITLDRAGAVRANGTISLIVMGVGGGSATRAMINYTEVR